MTGKIGLSLLVKPPSARSTTASVFGAIPLRQVEIVAHAELITVANHRRPRQREHQAVGQFEPTTIAVEHRCQRRRIPRS